LNPSNTDILETLTESECVVNRKVLLFHGANDKSSWDVVTCPDQGGAQGR